MLKLSCVALAATVALALGGCSRSAADPPADSPAPPAPPPAAAVPEGTESALPATPPGPVGGAPPTLAPLGPIPGPSITGENAATMVQNPYAGDPAALEQGRQLFIQMNCYGCH